MLRESQEARLAWLKGTDASGKGDEGKKKRGCNLNGYNPIMGLAPIFYKKRSFLPEPPFLQKVSHCHCEGAKRLKQSHRYSGIQRLPRSPRSLAMTNLIITRSLGKGGQRGISQACHCEKAARLTRQSALRCFFLCTSLFQSTSYLINELRRFTGNFFAFSFV